MRRLDTALQNSKQVIDESNAQRISREHALVVESIKSEFGISDFKNESEDVKKSVRSLVLEMWSPETGITKKGLAFVNEGVSTLTPDSTEQQIASYVRNHIMTSCRSYANSTLSLADFHKCVSDVCGDVVALTKGKCKKTDVKAEIAKSLAKSITAATGIALEPKKA